jgi:Asp-tRNA(Asn)/Glu-tRNA(Gln) amidotransferase A subunit family amidase
MSDELVNQSVAELARLMARREASPVAVVEAYLTRLGRIGRRLNAVVTLAEDAVEQAMAAERALLQGDGAGALCGVPLTVKDTIDVRGLRATAGTMVRAGRTARADAPAVARLREAGAIILGKTNCAELALDYTTDNPVFGRTLNPYDPERTPGGSSGGCAAAVAARLTAASLGSDLVGSIRVPAHFCGVVGFKPAGADVPRAGHMPPVVGAYMLGASFGPLTRTVADARLLYEVLSGKASAVNEAEGEQAAAVPSDSLKGVRFCRYVDDATAPVDEEVFAAVEAAIRALAEAGMIPSQERPPHVGSGSELWLKLISQATTRFLREEFAGREELAGPVARAVLRRGAEAVTQTADEDDALIKRREAMRAELLEWIERRPLLVGPVGSVAAFRHSESRRVEVAGRSLNTFRAFSSAQVCNVFDLPAISVPAGHTREGLPIGVQIAARPGAEGLLWAAAATVERALGGSRPPSDNAPQPGANPL